MAEAALALCTRAAPSAVGPQRSSSRGLQVRRPGAVACIGPGAARVAHNDRLTHVGSSRALGRRGPPALGAKARLARASASVAAGAATEANRKGQKEELKLNILRLVAGLDRGVAASADEAKRVEEAAAQLELEAALLPFTGSVASAASSTGPKYGLQDLDGTWRLVFSSGFAAGSLGGLRPGPPTGRLPILIGQVLQRIDVQRQELDNIVELRLGVLPWPLPAIELTATLAHSFEALGSATIRITFNKTSVKAGGADATSPLPAISTPELPEFLRPPSPTRSGQFETTFLDHDFRVSRGDLGELRIFVKAENLQETK